MNIDRPTQQLATQHIAPPLLMRYASEALEALAPNAPLLAVLVNEVVDYLIDYRAQHFQDQAPHGVSPFRAGIRPLKAATIEKPIATAR